MAKKMKACDIAAIFEALRCTMLTRHNVETPWHFKGVRVYAKNGFVHLAALRPGCTATVVLSKNVTAASQEHYFFIKNDDLKFICYALNKTPQELVIIDFTISPTAQKPVCRIKIGDWFEMEAGDLQKQALPPRLSMPSDVPPSQFNVSMSLHPFHSVLMSMGADVEILANETRVTAKNTSWFIDRLETLIY